MILSNETTTSQSVSFRVERDGETVHDEMQTVDPESESVIEEDWMAETGMYEFSVTMENDDQETTSGRAIPGDYDRGACIDVRIRRDDVSILQRLADGPCP